MDTYGTLLRVVAQIEQIEKRLTALETRPEPTPPAAEIKPKRTKGPSNG